MDIRPVVVWNIFDELAISVPHAIHIFKLEIDQYSDQTGDKLFSVLSPAEQIKSNRFLKKTDQIRYATTRHALRVILSKFTGIPPELIEFHKTGNKKPAINGVEFNVSHSGNISLIGVSTSALGIDVEYVNPDFDFSTLINTCFNVEEQLHIKLPEDFYLLWTRKEALLKNTGEGLSNELYEVTCMAPFALRDGIRYEIKSFSTEQYIFSLSSISHQQSLYFWNFMD